MKIQVVTANGSVEVINLVGAIIAHEPGAEFPYPRNQSPLHVDATGMDYYFREDGVYDGWGMRVAIPCAELPADGHVPPEAADFIKAVEQDREILGK